MPVSIRYEGGPRDGKKNMLRHTDTPPGTIGCEAEAKAKNMRGFYNRVTRFTEEPFVYIWVRQ